MIYVCARTELIGGTMSRYQLMSFTAGTCLPLVVIARLLSLSGISRCQIVFVESVCRVTSLSLTGTVLQYIADEALVQWPDLAGKYPRTKYIGKFL